MGRSGCVLQMFCSLCSKMVELGRALRMCTVLFMLWGWEMTCFMVFIALWIPLCFAVHSVVKIGHHSKPFWRLLPDMDSIHLYHSSDRARGTEPLTGSHNNTHKLNAFSQRCHGDHTSPCQGRITTPPSAREIDWVRVEEYVWQTQWPLTGHAFLFHGAEPHDCALQGSLRFSGMTSSLCRITCSRKAKTNKILCFCVLVLCVAFRLAKYPWCF